MNQSEVKKILKEIENGYDLVAGKFSQTRKYFWRDLEFIKEYAKDGDKIFDFGCGNGRLSEIFSDKKVEYWGADVSQKLVDLAKNKYQGKRCHFSKIDPGQTSLPFQNNFFNAVYSVAVFHHFPGKEHRELMARELFRITKPGGVVVITVWNLWNKKYVKNILKNWIKKFFGKSCLDWNDCRIAFKDNEGNCFSRFHHSFTGKEMQSLFSKAGFRCEKLVTGRNVVYLGRK